MKFTIFACCIGTVMLLCSCSRLYTPALYHQDIAYQPKPASFDTAKTANYVSAGLNTYLTTNYNDMLYSGQINISRGHVFNNFNLAYGAFGVFGDYNSSTVADNRPNTFTDKFFGAVGGRASANLFVHKDRADIRFIGIEAAYSHEFGSFASFRKSLYGQPGYYIDPRTDLYTIGLTTEVVFHQRNNVNIQHGIRGFLGTTLGHNPLEDTYYHDDNENGARFFRTIFPKASYFIKFKNYFGTFEVGSAVFIRFGYKF